MVGPTTATGSVRADLQASGNVGPEHHGAGALVPAGEQKGPGAEAAAAVDFTDSTCDGSGNNAVSNLEDVASVRPEHNGEEAKGRAVQDWEDSASVRPEDNGAAALVPAGEHPVKTMFPSISQGQHSLDIEDRMDMLVQEAAECKESKHEQRDDREETRALKKKKKAREADPQQREVRPRFSDSIDFWRVADFRRAAKVFFWQTTSHPRSHTTAILAPSSLC